MNITIISPGKAKSYISEDAVLEYTSRIMHHTRIEWRFTMPKDLAESSYIVVLDENGKEMDSIQFGNFLQSRLNESVKNLIFIIGDAYGISEEIKKRANLTLSLSKLVFPHELVRGILAEQIYRGFSIIKGEKYHHA